MAWTTPRTWATSELVTAAMMNSDVRDNANFMAFYKGARVYKSANQTVGSGATDVLSWDSETYDTNTIHDTVTNNSRLTVPSGMGGYWRAVLSVNHDSDAVANRRVQLSIRKNAAGASGGGTQIATQEAHGSDAPAHGSVLVTTNLLVAGDYIEAFVLSGAEAREVVGGANQSGLIFEFVGL